MDEYPSDEELRRIETWDNDDPHGMLAFVRSLWRYADAGYWEVGHRTRESVVFNRCGTRSCVYDLSTAGWSGNESLIDALKQHPLFWLMYWEQSRRGGHFRFAIPVTAPETVNPEPQDEGFA